MLTEPSPMQAGREMDARVGETVFGRRVAWHGGEPFWALRDPAALTFPTERVPAYSTDIAAAWTLVDELQRKGFDTFDLRTDPAGWSGKPWMALFSDGDRRYGYGDTAAEAICRAALEAARDREEKERSHAD